MSRTGHYLGTEVEGLWCRPTLTREPVVIRWADVRGARLGRWHAGRWAGGAPVVKLTWPRGGRRLVSGFVLSSDARVNEELPASIRQRVHRPTPGAAPAEPA